MRLATEEVCHSSILCGVVTAENGMDEVAAADKSNHVAILDSMGSCNITLLSCPTV